MAPIVLVITDDSGGPVSGPITPVAPAGISGPPDPIPT